MSRLAPRLVGPLLLILVYALCQFALPLWGTTIENHRSFLFMWAFVGILACGPIFTGARGRVRAIGGALVGLIAVILIPLWSSHGDRWTDLTAGMLSGILALLVGGAAAHYGPPLLARIPPRRGRWLSFAAFALVAALLLTSAATLPPFPRATLTLNGAVGPTVALRWSDTASFLQELRPKPWVGGGTYGGKVALGEQWVIQTLSAGRLRRLGLDGRTLPVPQLAPAETIYDSWNPAQVVADLMLLRRGGQLWLSRASDATVLATAAQPEQDIRWTELTASGAYLVDGFAVRAWDADGRERWVYRRPSRPVLYPQLSYRWQYALSSHSNSWQSRSLIITPAGPVAVLATDVTALTPDGQIRWQRLTDGEYLTLTASPNGGLVLVLEKRPLASEPGVAVGVVVALDGNTGVTRWEWPVPDDVFGLDWAVDDESILLSLDHRTGEAGTIELRALSHDGSQLWTRQAGDTELGPMLSTLSPVGDGYLIIGGQQALCLTRATGEARYTLIPDQWGGLPQRFDSSARPLMWGSDMVLTTGRHVYGFDAVTGERRWTFAEPYGVMGIAAYGDRLAIGNSRGVTVLMAHRP